MWAYAGFDMEEAGYSDFLDQVRGTCAILALCEEGILRKRIAIVELTVARNGHFLIFNFWQRGLEDCKD